MVVLAYDSDKTKYWLRCINCGNGLVENYDVTSPAPKPLRLPAGLPDIEGDVWNEVRECLSVGAFTAAVVLCRKLLVHVAVGHGLAAKNDRGFSPTFAAATEHLETEGLITPKMRPWVERIREVGNDANHELSKIDKADAFDVATFTEQLLILTYEMDTLMSRMGEGGVKPWKQQGADQRPPAE